MKIIDEYLDRLYEDDESKEAIELKEELKEHLLTSTKEFIKRGVGSEEAQKKAIEQFDGNSDSESSVELRSIYTKKIDIKKERVKKISSIRLKIFNASGWFFGAACLSAHMNFYGKAPSWLIVVLVILISILIVLSIIISTLKMSMDK